jgi:DNA-binding response OmpR family regulator
MQRLCSTIAPSVSGEISIGRFQMKDSTLLCVDDDLGILEFYETMLGSNGYHVLLAQDGRQALAVFEEKVKEIDAVISDYEMPGMNGIELAAQLKRHNSSLPVIMISGCVPLLDNIRHNVDILLSKGAPVEEILARIEFLLCLKRKASAFSIS